MATINRDKHFLFTEADTFGHLLKLIYRGGHIKAIASKNPLFVRRSTIYTCLRKSIFGGGHTIRPATEKDEAQQAQRGSISDFKYKYIDSRVFTPLSPFV
jgi:hypothetical protein